MITINNEQEMQQFGEKVGSFAAPGDIIELVGDVGAGKTTFVRGLAKGMNIDETVQSPSFTINRAYESADGRRLAHYDFYRLSEPGIMKDELADTIVGDDTIIVIEWAAAVESVLPLDRLTVTIRPDGEDRRLLDITTGGAISERLRSKLG